MENRMDHLVFVGPESAATDLRIDEFSFWTDPAGAAASMCWCRVDDSTGESPVR